MLVTRGLKCTEILRKATHKATAKSSEFHKVNPTYQRLKSCESVLVGGRHSFEEQVKNCSEQLKKITCCLDKRRAGEMMWH